jgi:hypothetical protein
MRAAWLRSARSAAPWLVPARASWPRASASAGLGRGFRRLLVGNPPTGRAEDAQRGMPAAYSAVTAGLSRTSRTGSVSSSSAMASRDFTKSENER